MRVTTIDRAVFFTAGVCLGLAAGLPLGLVAAEPKRSAVQPMWPETLEAMARALFQSWFVDFDPVHLRLSYGGQVRPG